MKGWLLSFLFMSVSIAESQSLGDKVLEERARRGIDEVYNLDFEEAEKEFNEIIRQRSKDPAGYAFLAIVDWWRILIDMDDTQYDERFYNQLDRVIDLCDEILEKDETDVNALFFKGGAIGFEGRLKFHRDDWLAAANAGRKALPIVQAASLHDRKNYDIMLGNGIYNYYAEVLPEEYPLVKPLLLFVPRGDRKKGIEQLKTAWEKGKYASVEAGYFLMQIYYTYEKDYVNALSIAEQLHSRFPNNMLFHRYLGRCCVSLGNWPKVGQIFSDISSRVQKNQRGYGPSSDREAEYYLGLCDMNARRYESALKHLYRCDELSRNLDKKETSGFMAMANLKIGMAYDALAKRDLAVMQYQKVLAMNEYQDSHKQAEKFVKTPFAQ